MSNETKRDVFGQLLNAYQNLSVKDIEIHDESYRENITTPWNIVYANALPDDLPTILECVSKEIKDGYGKNSLLDELAWANQDALPSSKVSEWINDNEALFAEAWSRGLWVVKETGEVTGYDG
ncbi:hypothetical protein [Lacticaseibacillus paracasei]|uniref:hypothetical protein n=1 Tax=Lacticaseibacillus paracasei TaxID=1597 RepID=UPI0015F83963|nr:hypothetical protein [Lacticaseibacillus paracasei]MBB1167262.1 hypothetical protein [Lacticaseibacillus paracasei]